MSYFEKILKLKGYPLPKAQEELARIQSMSQDEFIHWQQEKAWQIAKFHYTHNEMYKKLVGNHLPDRWDDLPVVTKKHLQKPLSEIISNGLRLSDCHTGSTSGSTGIPFHFAKDKMAHAMTWAVIYDRYKWYDISFSSKQARFYGIPKEFLANRKELLKDLTMNRQRFSVFDMSPKVLDGFVKRFKKNNFDYVYGYTNSLVMFARHLLNKQIVLKDICPTLRLAICTSETCTEEDNEILNKAFGVPVIREYGLSETCLTAFDHAGVWKITEETLFTEVVDELNQQLPSGNEGRILSTSLYNTALPMVRYQTGDIGIIGNERNGIYRNLEKLTGRTNDTIILPSGKKAPGLTFYYIARSVLEMSGVLHQFIVRQTTNKKFVFDIVADRDLSKKEKELVKEKISLYLETGLDIEFNRVESIERHPSGKLKHFYSELDSVE